MKTFDLFWSPEGRRIATVEAETGWQARKMAPQPYRKYIGEIYSVQVSPQTCGECGEEWPCSVVKSPAQYRGNVVAKHHVR